MRHTARHVVVATGSDPVVPPVPGLRELDGVWTNREVTGMKAIPRRLLILGGGPVGAEMAQAVRRLGGEVALVEAAGHVLAREPAPLGEALGEVLRDDGIELLLGLQRDRRTPGRRGIRPGPGGRPGAPRRPSAPGDGRQPRSRDRPGDGRRHARCARHRCRRAPACGDRLWAIGDVTGVRLLTHVGKYQGEVAASNILGEPREASYAAVPDVIYTDPQAASVGAVKRHSAPRRRCPKLPRRLPIPALTHSPRGSSPCSVTATG